MEQCFIKRHEDYYNKYVQEVLERKDIISIISKDIDADNFDYSNITKQLIGKRLFSFLLYKGTTVTGIFCLEEIDWENRNCRLKLGLFDEYLNDYDHEYVRTGINNVLDFCKSNIRLKRVWGIVPDRDNNKIECLQDVFKVEGKTKSEDYIYMGHILE